MFSVFKIKQKTGKANEKAGSLRDLKAVKQTKGVKQRRQRAEEGRQAQRQPGEQRAGVKRPLRKASVLDSEF